MKELTEIEKNLRRCRLKLWEIMYSNQEEFTLSEYQNCHEACVLITEAMKSIQSRFEGEKGE